MTSGNRGETGRGSATPPPAVPNGPSTTRRDGGALMENVAESVWLIRLDDDTEYLITGRTFLGSAPRPYADGLDRNLVKIGGRVGSVAATHALIEPTADHMRVGDLGSPHGTFVAVDGDEQAVTPGSSLKAPVGARVRLGDRTFDLVSVRSLPTSTGDANGEHSGDHDHGAADASPIATAESTTTASGSASSGAVGGSANGAAQSRFGDAAHDVIEGSTDSANDRAPDPTGLPATEGTLRGPNGTSNGVATGTTASADTRADPSSDRKSNGDEKSASGDAHSDAKRNRFYLGGAGGARRMRKTPEVPAPSVQTYINNGYDLNARSTPSEAESEARQSPPNEPQPTPSAESTTTSASRSAPDRSTSSDSSDTVTPPGPTARESRWCLGCRTALAAHMQFCPDCGANTHVASGSSPTDSASQTSNGSTSNRSTSDGSTSDGSSSDGYGQNGRLRGWAAIPDRRVVPTQHPLTAPTGTSAPDPSAPDPIAPDPIALGQSSQSAGDTETPIETPTETAPETDTSDSTDTGGSAGRPVPGERTESASESVGNATTTSAPLAASPVDSSTAETQPGAAPHSTNGVGSTSAPGPGAGVTTGCAPSDGDNTAGRYPTSPAAVVPPTADPAVLDPTTVASVIPQPTQPAGSTANNDGHNNGTAVVDTAGNTTIPDVATAPADGTTQPGGTPPTGNDQPNNAEAARVDKPSSSAHTAAPTGVRPGSGGHIDQSSTNDATSHDSTVTSKLRSRSKQNDQPVFGNPAAAKPPGTYPSRRHQDRSSFGAATRSAIQPAPPRPPSGQPGAAPEQGAAPNLEPVVGRQLDAPATAHPPADRQVSDHGVVHQDVAHQHIANQDIATQDIANQDIANQQVALGHAGLPRPQFSPADPSLTNTSNAATNIMASGDAAVDSVAPSNASTNNVASGDAAVDSVAPSNASTNNVASGDAAVDSAAPSNAADTSRTNISRTKTSDAAHASAAASYSVANEITASDVVASDIDSDVAHSQAASDQGMVEQALAEPSAADLSAAAELDALAARRAKLEAKRRRRQRIKARTTGMLESTEKTIAVSGVLVALAILLGGFVFIGLRGDEEDPGGVANAVARDRLPTNPKYSLNINLPSDDTDGAADLLVIGSPERLFTYNQRQSELQAFDKRGNELWSEEIEGVDAPAEAFQSYDGDVISLTWARGEGTLSRWDGRSGDKKWDTTVRSPYFILYGDSAFVFDVNHSMDVVDLDDGDQTASVDVEKFGDRWHEHLVMTGRFVAYEEVNDKTLRLVVLDERLRVINEPIEVDRYSRGSFQGDDVMVLRDGRFTRYSLDGDKQAADRYDADEFVPLGGSLWAFNGNAVCGVIDFGGDEIKEVWTDRCEYRDVAAYEGTAYLSVDYGRTGYRVIEAANGDEVVATSGELVLFDNGGINPGGGGDDSSFVAYSLPDEKKLFEGQLEDGQVLRVIDNGYVVIDQGSGPDSQININVFA